MEQKHSFDEDKEQNMPIKPSEGQSVSEKKSSARTILIIAVILALFAVAIILGSGYGKTLFGNSDQQTKTPDTSEAIDQKDEELKQEAEAIERRNEALQQELEAFEQEVEARELEFEALAQQSATQNLSDSEYVGVWEITLIEKDGEYIDLAGTGVFMEYHLNPDGTAKAIATGHDDVDTTWEEYEGTLVINSASGEKPELIGRINGYGQLIIHNEAENMLGVFERR